MKIKAARRHQNANGRGQEKTTKVRGKPQRAQDSCQRRASCARDDEDVFLDDLDTDLGGPCERGPRSDTGHAKNHL